MAQQGSIWRKGNTWFLRYRDNFNVDGRIVRKLTCVKLAEYGDRYRCKKDLQELVSERMSGVREAAKCPQSSESFVKYVEDVYLPMVQRTKSASTYAGYRTYWLQYLRPRVGKYALRDFTVAVISNLLDDITTMHSLNTETVKKIRSVLCAVFTFAMGKGSFPGKSASENPASCALIPESATDPQNTVAASRKEVTATLAALKGMPLERAAVALMAFGGFRPSEARGLRWEEWDRQSEHIAVKRAVWHRSVGETKTANSVRFVTVTLDLREILLALWRSQGSPLGGYILAGRKGQPIVLDNVSKRRIRPMLEAAGIPWHGWYSLRRFHGTEVRMKSDSSETTAKALGNTRAVADGHYIKPQTVLPDVRKAVNEAFSGLIQ